MLIDHAGNTLESARQMLIQPTQIFTDSVHSSDPLDFYHLKLNNKSQVRLELDGLSRDADLKLFDQNGQLIEGSYGAGTANETLSRELLAGEYYVLVSQHAGYTDYRLKLSLQDLEAAAAPTIPLRPSVNVVTIANPNVIVPPLSIAGPPPAEQLAVTADPGIAYAPRSGINAIDALLHTSGVHWDTTRNGGTITYSFYDAATGAYEGSEQATGVNEGVKRNVREIFQTIEQYLNVRFVEVTETATQQGAIRYMFSNGDGGPFYAYSYYPAAGIGGDIHLSARWEQDEVGRFSGAIGSYGYAMLMHETLHALGLKHPGDYDALGSQVGGAFLATGLDHQANSIMSYNAVGNYARSPMAYDVRALQYLYGAPVRESQNSTYHFLTTTSYRNGDNLIGDSLRPLKQTLWDSAGFDRLDLSSLARNQSYYVDLRPGGWITAQSARNGGYIDRVTGQRFSVIASGTVIAFGTTIEGVVSSGADDWIVANEANNLFAGYSNGKFGQDVIENATANDVLDLSGVIREDLVMEMDGADLWLRWRSGDAIRLLNYFSTGNLKLRFGGQDYEYHSQWGWRSLMPLS
jgi:hypothetical protein